jgi:hypothetical protein
VVNARVRLTTNAMFAADFSLHDDDERSAMESIRHRRATAFRKSPVAVQLDCSSKQQSPLVFDGQEKQDQ